MADLTVSSAFVDEKKKEPSVDSLVVDEKLAISDHEVELTAGNAPIVDLRAAALSDRVGDVFDDVRAVDLGADGKERPIGKLL